MTTFGMLAAGERFRFASERTMPHSGMKTGECVKVSARRYLYVDDGMLCAVGSVRVEVDRTLPPMDGGAILARVVSEATQRRKAAARARAEGQAKRAAARLAEQDATIREIIADDQREQDLIERINNEAGR